MLFFIPNEQIYQYIHEHDPSLIDTAMRSKVVLGSPISLFAILLVIRQAVDNFTLEQGSNEIVSQMGAFNKQWVEFLEQLTTVERRLESFQSAFRSLIGTRRRGLERPLKRIDAIRQERGLGLPADVDDPEDSEDIEFQEPLIIESRDGKD